ncbi:MAG: Lrp/AsnC family transcriptional regulator [Desulfobacterales bacterium]|jgi:Lrp/AsnC family leucine-responsive transcriptional regulator|nr:Lrp/AsnC family transcriptional regulator [Desulfobacterales bacterium]
MLDDISLQILKILQEKARVPNTEVARQVGMAPSGVLERVRKLEKQGIIDGYEVRLNPGRFGRSLVAFIRVEPESGADEAALGRALAAISDVQEVHHLAGEDCFLVKLRARDPEALAQIRAAKIAGLPGVGRTRTLIALSTFKESARIPLDDGAVQNLTKRRR